MRKRAARLALGTLLLLAVAPSAAAGQEISFAPLQLYPHGDDVGGDRLVTGDLNGDGRSDVVVADAAAARVTVRLARADGTLGPPVVHAFDATLGVRLVDVNGDGDLDLLLSGADALRVALGGPGGSFGPPTPVASVVGDVDVVSDFNGDGDPDLAMTDEAGINVLVLLGGPAGTFGAPTPYLVGDPGTRTVAFVTSADLNGDGDPDLIASLPSRVVVLVGGAGGSFSESARFEGEGFPTVLGDFNGDGDPDLVTTPATAVLRVRLGQAGSGFGPPTDYESVFFTQTLFALDLDQDGDDELIEWAPTFSEIEPGTLRVRAGDPSGQLGPPVTTTIPELASSPQFDDFNRDGDPDLAFVNTIAIGDPPTGEIRVLAGAAGTSFTVGPSTFVGSLSSPGPMVTGDFNGDRRTDLVLLATLFPVPDEPLEGPVIGVWLNTTVLDRTRPKITIRTPRHGAKYSVGQTVLADYECVDRESAVTTCAGPVPDGQPIDTASAGHKTFRVVARSAGGTTVRQVHYRVR